MTKFLEKAFQEAQKLSDNLQNEIAQQLLIDIENELKWQETLADPDINLNEIFKNSKFSAAILETTSTNQRNCQEKLRTLETKPIPSQFRI